MAEKTRLTLAKEAPENKIDADNNKFPSGKSLTIG